MNKKLTKLLSFGVIAGLLLGALPAKAQTEEIIVTARKRQESILKVPVVESVISQESITKYALTSFQDIGNRVPGIVTGAAIGIIGTNMSIRGVGVSGTNPIVDQDVLLSVDGLPLTQGMAYTAASFDLGQVEVLKGPQSLFYGKNSPAGVISLRSADPTDKAEIVLSSGYEVEAKQKIAEVIVSGPVAPTLKLRLAAHFDDQKGWAKNLAVGIPALGGQTPTFSNFAPDKNWIIRGTALFDPNDRYSARLKANYSRRELRGSGGDGETNYCPDGATFGAGNLATLPFLVGNDCKLNGTFYSAWANPAAFPGIPMGGEYFDNINQTYGSLEQNLKVGSDLTLTSLSTYYDMNIHSLLNGSSSNAAPVLVADNHLNNQQFTQELRVTSDFTSPLNFMLGGFYQKQLLKSHPILRTNRFLFPFPNIGDTRHTIAVDSISAFGQLIWKISPQFELAGGGRYTHEKRHHREFNESLFVGAPLGEVTRPDPFIRSSNFSPEVTLTYTPTDDLTVFGSFKQAYKSGSFNAVTFVNAATLSAFADEKVTGGEGGIKARLFDRRARANLSGYYLKYAQIQVGASQSTPQGAVVSRTINAASAKIYGFDFDFTYEPEGIEGLALNGAVNYNHARYGSFKNAPCSNAQTIAEGCNQLLNPATGRFTSQDLSGRKLIRAPAWTGTFGFDYDRPIGEMTLGLGASVSFMSKYYTNVIDYDTPGFTQKGFAKLNLNIALKGPNNGWELAIVGNNITDKITAGYCFNSNIQGATVLGGVISGSNAVGNAGKEEAGCIPDRGRTVLLRVTLRPLAWVK